MLKKLWNTLPFAVRARLHRPQWYLPLGILALMVIIFVIMRTFFGGGDDTILTGLVQKGTFEVSITEVGELRATRSRTVSAPQGSGELTIVQLAAEGSEVKAGDTLATFETSRLETSIADLRRDLEQSRSALAKAMAQQDWQNAQLEADKKNAEASYRLAELSLQSMQYEAEIEKQKKKLQQDQAEISRDQTMQRIESQQQINAAEHSSLQLSVRQAESRLQKALDQLKGMTLLAPENGLVVYQRTWRSDRKFRRGDNVWGGQPILELPDLSDMQVVTQVNEVDVAKVKPGQAVEIALDAFPGPIFKGVIENVASLAGESHDEGRLKSFDVIVTVLDHDPRLRPGMTTRNRIIVDRLPDQLSVPIEAIMFQEDTTVVYKKRATGWGRIAVKTGAQNEIRIAVGGKLTPGSQVALSDPFRKEESKPSSAGSGDKAR